MGEPAPFCVTADAPPPDGGGAEWLRAADGRRLRAALFAPPGPARGSVVLSPGRTEYIEKYFEAVRDLQGRGFAVLVHDWRGQGRSDRLLPDPLAGHAAGLQPFIDDFRALLDGFEARLPKPWINLAHSMGGALTTLALAAGERRFAGSVLSAPMFGIRTGQAPAWLARGLALTFGRFRPSAYVSAGGDPSGEVRLSHDMVREGRWRAQLAACPDLQLGNVTWGWLAMALEATGRLASDPGVASIDIPVVVVGAGADDLIDARAQQAVARRLPHGRYVEIPAAHHELLMEQDAFRERFWAEFDQLAREVIPPTA
jgi:lysophospholipase